LAERSSCCLCDNVVVVAATAAATTTTTTNSYLDAGSRRITKTSPWLDEKCCLANFQFSTTITDFLMAGPTRLLLLTSSQATEK
jgi:hypothetical protein